MNGSFTPSQKKIVWLSMKGMDGRASHEGLCRANLKAVHVQQTRCNCPILLMDMYHCHMIELVFSTITQLGVEVVDVGINKSLKSKV